MFAASYQGKLKGPQISVILSLDEHKFMFFDKRILKNLIMTTHNLDIWANSVIDGISLKMFKIGCMG